MGPASVTEDLCADASNIGVFCSPEFGGGFDPWSNFGGGFATAAFYKDQFGIVHLRGVVKHVEEAANSPITRRIFRLPSSYRPESTRIFASIGRGADGEDVAQARIDVQPNGLVVFDHDCDNALSDCSATGGYLTLDGISFRPDE